MADLNTVPTVPAARQPRAIVKLGGVAVPGWIEWEVDTNIFYQADTFRVSFALATPGMPVTATWFAALTTTTPVEIMAGFPADPTAPVESELVRWMYGNPDDVSFDPVKNTVELTGRDLTSLLIDTKTTEKWPNKTSSDIAAALATRHGLTPVVTATTTKVGRYYEIDHVRLTDERSEWDLLTWLAHEEQFIVYVRGQELHFEPKPDPATASAYVLDWQPPTSDSGSPVFNGTAITLSRNLTLARDIIVTVHSWNQKNAQGFSRTVRATKNGLLVASAPQTGAPESKTVAAQNYSYTIPNLTPDAALQKAQSILADLSQHEMRLAATMPADDLLDVTSVIRLQGTATAFDQDYFPESVTRRMSMAQGYSMSTQAKNHSSESVVVA